MFAARVALLCNRVRYLQDFAEGRQRDTPPGTTTARRERSSVLLARSLVGTTIVPQWLRATDRTCVLWPALRVMISSAPARLPPQIKGRLWPNATDTSVISGGTDWNEIRARNSSAVTNRS